jgi:hypothetical protein
MAVVKAADERQCVQIGRASTGPEHQVMGHQERVAPRGELTWLISVSELAHHRRRRSGVGGVHLADELIGGDETIRGDEPIVRHDLVGGASNVCTRTSFRG